VEQLRQHGCMDYTTVVAATGDRCAAWLRFIIPKPSTARPAVLLPWLADVRFPIKPWGAAAGPASAVQ